MKHEEKFMNHKIICLALLFLSSMSFATCLSTGEYRLQLLRAYVNHDPKRDLDPHPQIEVYAADEFDHDHFFLLQNGTFTLGKEGGRRSSMAWSGYPSMFTKDGDLWMEAKNLPYGLSDDDFPIKIASIGDEGLLILSSEFKEQLSLRVENDSIVKRSSMLLHPLTLFSHILGYGYDPFSKPRHNYSFKLSHKNKLYFFLNHSHRHHNWCFAK